MSLWCLQSSFDSIRSIVWEEMSFEEFQDGHHDGHLGYLNRRILAILNLCVTVMLPIKFWSIQLMVWEEMSFEEFHNGVHGGLLGYQNCTTLAILNPYVAPMPPIKFWLNPTYGLGDVIWSISRWPPWWPSWIWEQNDFSNSGSLQRSKASHQVSAQSDLLFGIRCPLKNFKMAAMATILDIKSKSKYFYSLKVKYNMTSEEMEIQSCSQDGYRNFIYIITVG